MRLTRHPASPVLRPNPFNDWEALNVFNPAVVFEDDLFHMLYRAQGTDYVSRIGYAVSRDGVRWNRLQEPVFVPSGEAEARGVEDPRVTALGGRYYMAYTAYGRQGRHPDTGAAPSAVTPMYAVSNNLISWERIGPVVEGEDNKDHALFPERVGGRYVTFHRRPPSIWLAFSHDLRAWTDHEEILAPRPGLWDGKRIGAGGPPIPTPAGWLVLYHGNDEHHIYRMGTALLSLEDPRRVLARPAAPILEPAEPWEVKGDVPNVVFGTANPVVHGVVYLYYGAADRVIGLATAPLSDVLAWTIETGR